MLPLADLSRRSPELRAKADPYSNKTHKRIDAVLVVITLVLMIFAFRASAQHRATSNEPTRTAQTAVHK
jgi:hypothetical protein